MGRRSLSYCVSPTIGELPTPEERKTAELVGALRASGNLRPLVAMLRDPDGGPERARDALLMLGELDVALFAQIALDTLIDDYLEDPAFAAQARRDIGGARGAPGELTRRAAPGRRRASYDGTMLPASCQCSSSSRVSRPLEPGVWSPRLTSAGDSPPGRR
jgi:hypothetical protein